MLMDFLEKGKVCVQMEKYVKDMIETFPFKIQTPSTDGLVNFGSGAKLSTKRQEALPFSIAKGLFLSKWA